jgi:hypothetical protein
MARAVTAGSEIPLPIHRIWVQAAAMITEPANKPKLPEWATFPVGFQVLQKQFDTVLPSERLTLFYSGMFGRMAMRQDSIPIAVLHLEYSPNSFVCGWSLRVYPVLKQDKAMIRDTLLKNGFALLITFLRAEREALWKDLSFGRYLVWHSPTKILSFEDRNQIGKDPHGRSIVPENFMM